MNNIKINKLLALIIVFATFLGMSYGKTIYVNANFPVAGNGTDWSSPYTNLQDAVTASAAGDLVLVTNGVYSPISTGNKAITIQSVEGSSVTSIDGGGTTRCATLGTGVVLKGFTVCNGYTTGNGGGSSGGTLIGCTISGNTANSNGGGSYGGTLSGCVISNNVTTLYDGGGTYSSTVTNCTISGNTANGNGGGSYNGTLTGCTISGNTANRHGGGSFGGTLIGCTIFGNTANNNGGGSSSGTLTDCTISGNTAATYGGGSNGGTLTDCTISGNTAERGGGINDATVYDSDIIGNISSSTSYSGGGTYGGTLYRCRIYNNGAPNGYGGGANRSILYDCVITNNTAIRGSAFADAGRTYNCTMSYNIATQGGVTYYGTHYNSTIVNNQCGLFTTWNGTYRNSIIWGNSTSDHSTTDAYEYSNADTLISGVGNISVDPLFVDASAGDFRLQPNSPCINKGANQYVTTATDLLGSPRIKDWRVDMGAYESQSTRFVTTPNALYPMGTKDIK